MFPCPDTPRSHEIMSGSFISNHKVKHAFDPPVSVLATARRCLGGPQLHTTSLSAKGINHYLHMQLPLSDVLPTILSAPLDLCTSLVTWANGFTKWSKCILKRKTLIVALEQWHKWEIQEASRCSSFPDGTCSLAGVPLAWAYRGGCSA